MKIFAIGDRVLQPQYGAGTITAADARHTVIDFDLHGSRRFVTTMVRLTPTTEPAPPRQAKSAGRRAPRAKA
jgi:hypothetical protein